MYISSNHVCVYLSLLRESDVRVKQHIGHFLLSSMYIDRKRSYFLFTQVFVSACVCVYSTFAEYSFRRLARFFIIQYKSSNTVRFFQTSISIQLPLQCLVLFLEALVVPRDEKKEVRDDLQGRSHRWRRSVRTCRRN